MPPEPGQHLQAPFAAFPIIVPTFDVRTEMSSAKCVGLQNCQLVNACKHSAAVPAWLLVDQIQLPKLRCKMTGEWAPEFPGSNLTPGTYGT